MNLDKILRGLKAETRREILKLLCKKDMTAPEIYSALGKRAPVYRQSINKSLELLKEVGLVEKYYEDTKKALYYKITKKVYVIKLDQMSVE